MNLQQLKRHHHVFFENKNGREFYNVLNFDGKTFLVTTSRDDYRDKWVAKVWEQVETGNTFNRYRLHPITRFEHETMTTARNAAVNYVDSMRQ